MAVSGIREDDSRGRHTTTHRQLIKLPSGVIVIDTPGMRELGMWDVSIGWVKLLAMWRAILDCANSGIVVIRPRPGCAVRAAIESGELSIERWESYLKLEGSKIFRQ